MTLHFLSSDHISELKQIIETYINFEPISSHDIFVLDELSPLLDLEVSAIGYDKISFTDEERNLYYLRFFTNLIRPTPSDFESSVEYVFGTACCAFFSNQDFSKYNWMQQVVQPKLNEWDKQCVYVLFKCWMNLISNTDITTNIDIIYTLRQNQLPFEQEYIASLDNETKSQLCCELISYYHLLKATETLSLQLLNIEPTYDIDLSLEHSFKIYHNNINIEIFRDWIQRACFVIDNK